jgi:hypothetical protein
MSLKSLLFGPNSEVTLNPLKRFTLSAVVVPSQDNAIAQVPAGSANNPGRSRLIPIQGPQDGKSEIYSFTGKEGLTTQGIGLITTTGGDVNVVGIGTKFLAQLQVGSVIKTTAGNGTIATISSDTVATTTLAMAANTAANFFVTITPTTNSLNSMSVLVNDQGWRRYLMNRDVPVKHVFGSNTKPLFLKESLLLETDQTFQLQFLNYGSDAASFAPISEGRKWQMEALKNENVFNYIAGLRERKTYIQPYWLTLNNRFISVPAGGQATAFLTCTGDITLVLFNVYSTAVIADGTDHTNDISVAFQDGGTHRAMQAQPMPLALCTGTAENPFRLSTPWILEPQRFIQADFQNSGNANVNVYLTFHGVAVYTGSNFRGSTLTNKNLIREAAKMYDAMSTPTIIEASPQN